MRIAATGLALLGLAISTAQAAEPMELGEKIYTTICQGCHMANGEGATGAGTYPKLAGNPNLASWQFAAVTVLLGRKGMPPLGTMPGMDPAAAAFSGSLSDEEIAAVVNYIRSHFGNSFKDKAAPKDVSALPHPGEKGGDRAG